MMKTVLVLEDDAVSLALYRRVLGRQCTVISAETPDDALQSCRSETLDLFIADNLLGASLSGVETMLCAHEIKPALPFLLVSGTPPEGFSGADFRCFEKLVEAEQLTFLPKPFDSRVFVSTALSIMDGKAKPEDTRRQLATAIAYRQHKQGHPQL
jgi:DNA-binding NtrC family response regulator